MASFSVFLASTQKFWGLEFQMEIKVYFYLQNIFKAFSQMKHKNRVILGGKGFSFVFKQKGLGFGGLFFLPSRQTPRQGRGLFWWEISIEKNEDN
jgi:hypothetical protein